MSKEIWKDQEAYDVVFNHLNNCTCQDGKLLTRSALDHIYKALKRNEPMKVISFDASSYYGGLGYFMCPKCEEILTKGYYNYCPNCGQKLDWSDEK